MFDNIETDLPIDNFKDDKLSRKSFVYYIVDKIMQCDVNNRPFCIGITGSWGNGKSSVLNMLPKALPGKDSKGKLICLKFDPWNFNSEDDILHQYFDTLYSQLLNQQDHSKALDKIAHLIKDYGGLIKVGVPFLNITVADIAKSIGTNLAFLAKSKKGLADIKQEIADKIKECTDFSKIIVLIDNIDRLTSTEIQLIFHMVSSLADFPKTVFILAYDEDIVLNALSTVQGNDSRRYLEKIIQLPIRLPYMSETVKRSMLLECIRSLRRHNNYDTDDSGYMHLLLPYCLKLIENIRDIKRLYNTLDARVYMIGKAANMTDLTIISLLEEKEHELYDWIRTHKSALTGDNNTTSEFSSEEISALSQAKGNILSSYQISRILCLMFPEYASATGSSGYTTDIYKMRRTYRMCLPEFFDRYYSMNLETSKISSGEIKSIVTGHPENLPYFIISLAEMHEIHSFAVTIEEIIENISENTKVIIIQSLIENDSIIEATSSSYEQDPQPARQESRLLIQYLLERISSPSIYKIMRTHISPTDKDDIDMSHFLMHLILESDQGSSTIRSLLKKDQIHELGNLYISGIFEIDKSFSLMDSGHPEYYMDIRYIDKDNFNLYLQKKFQLNPLNKLKFLEGCLAITGNNYFLQIDQSVLTSIIDDKDIWQTLDKARADGRILELSDNQLYAVAAYKLLKETAGDDDSLSAHLGKPVADCQALANQWKEYL